MADLTDEELAELRSRTLAPVARGTPAMLLGADVVSRLLDEIERRRVQDLLDAPRRRRRKPPSTRWRATQSGSSSAVGSASSSTRRLAPNRKAAARAEARDRRRTSTRPIKYTG
jgi:hypothetical protein